MHTGTHAHSRSIHTHAPFRVTSHSLVKRAPPDRTSQNHNAGSYLNVLERIEDSLRKISAAAQSDPFQGVYTGLAYISAWHERLARMQTARIQVRGGGGSGLSVLYFFFSYSSVCLSVGYFLSVFLFFSLSFDHAPSLLFSCSVSVRVSHTSLLPFPFADHLPPSLTFRRNGHWWGRWGTTSTSSFWRCRSSTSPTWTRSSSRCACCSTWATRRPPR
jgi:hypothetical protein